MRCVNCEQETEYEHEPLMGGSPETGLVHVSSGMAACFPERGPGSPLVEAPVPPHLRRLLEQGPHVPPPPPPPGFLNEESEPGPEASSPTAL